MKILLIGEAWGRVEDEYKHALVGASGLELARMLAESGIAPWPHHKYSTAKQMIDHWTRLRKDHKIAVSNVFYARPPGNKIELFFGKEGNHDLPALKAGKYVLPEYMPHIIKLWAEIDELKPNLVVAMGNSAVWALLGRASISAVRGTVQWSERCQVKVLPCFHPAFILRDWSLRPTTVADLIKANREAEFPEIRRIERWITTHDHVSGARLSLDEIAEWFTRPVESYSIDIETAYILYSKLELEKMTPKQRYRLSSMISMVGFARNPYDALVIPFMDRSMENLSYWPNMQEEIQAWRHTYRALKSPVPKTMQNTLYDATRFAEIGITVPHCKNDPMLQHHALFPEMRKSLGFLASLYSNEVSWKTAYSDREGLKRDE